MINTVVGLSLLLFKSFILDMTTGLKYSEDYSAPEAEMVLVRFASHPEAKNSKIDPTSLPAFHAVAEYLINK